jgi:hypothetical protein
VISIPPSPGIHNPNDHIPESSPADAYPGLGLAQSAAESGQAKATPTRIVVRAQNQSGTDGVPLEGSDARDVFRRALETDVSALTFPIIQILDGEISLLDLDTHHLSEKPSRAQLEAHAGSIYPLPDAWWTTHGSGLRLAYLGPDHEQAAIAAALSVPSFFKVEFKKDTRHPARSHPRYPTATAGPVHWGEGRRSGGVDWVKVGLPSDEQIEEILDAHHLQPGGRYDHDRCPLAGSEESDAKGCVQVYPSGIYCFRCAAKQIRARPGLPPGFVPFRLLGGDEEASSLVDATQGVVHWRQALVQLQRAYPHLHEDVLRKAYRLTLEAVHGDDDPRVGMVFNPDLLILFSESGLVDADSLVLVSKPTRDTFDALPAIYRVARGLDEGGMPTVKLQVRTAVRDRVRNNLPLEAHVPVRVVRGAAFHELVGTIAVVKQPSQGDPVRLLMANEVLSETDAFGLLILIRRQT